MTTLLLILLAAPGDLGYKTETQVEVSPANAANLAQAFKDVNAWSALKTDITRCAVEVEGDGFRAWCMGDKAADPNVLPLNVLTHGWRGTDLLYGATEFASITIDEAKAMADNFKALGGWVGLRNLMTSCCVQKDTSSSTGFMAICKGTVFVDPGLLPEGSKVVARE